METKDNDKAQQKDEWWWGYIHRDGSPQAKRYIPSFSRVDILDAKESPFCQYVHGPFPCENRDEALRIVENAFTGKKDIDDSAKKQADDLVKVGEYILSQAKKD